MHSDVGFKGPKFCDVFSLDMQRVLIEEIKSSFQKLTPVPLSADNLAKLRKYEDSLKTHRVKKGIYILHHGGVVCYVGKTDESLSERLSDHFEKLSARMNIHPGEVSFRCLYLDVNWSALAHEERLIQEYKGERLCGWNYSGFGIHDPGRRRDTTRLDKKHFDRRYPVNPDIVVKMPITRGTIADLLPAIKRGLPYLLRFEGGKKPSAEYSKVLSLAKVSHLTARNILYAIADALGPSWQVTFLYGYVILYRENRDYGAECGQAFKIGGKVENVV